MNENEYSYGAGWKETCPLAQFCPISKQARLFQAKTHTVKRGWHDSVSIVMVKLLPTASMPIVHEMFGAPAIYSAFDLQPWHNPCGGNKISKSAKSKFYLN